MLATLQQPSLAQEPFPLWKANIHMLAVPFPFAGI